MQNVTTPKNHLSTDTKLPVSEREFLDEWKTTDIEELQLGMIRSALDDIRDGRKSKKMQQEAKEWLLSTDSQSPFSFINCCQSAGLNPYVLLNMVDKLLQGELYS